MHPDDIPLGIAPHRAHLGQPRISRDAWDTIKERYLRGEGAAFLAGLFGVSLSAVRTRARLEGWRRADGPDPDVTAPPTLDELAKDGRPNLGVMADTATRRAARAVAEGQLQEALGWSRVARTLAAASRRERLKEAE